MTFVVIAAIAVLVVGGMWLIGARRSKTSRHALEESGEFDDDDDRDDDGPVHDGQFPETQDQPVVEESEADEEDEPAQDELRYVRQSSCCDRCRS